MKLSRAHLFILRRTVPFLDTAINVYENKKSSTGFKSIDSIIDNKVRLKVQPKVGSVVFCGLAFNQVEYTGIYIGDNKIAHLNGNGMVEAVTPKEFLKRLNGFNAALSIYVSCINEKSVGSAAVVRRARNKIGTKLNYSVVSNNCHKFTSGCLTGNFDNTDTWFCELESTVKRELGLNKWRVWKY